MDGPVGWHPLLFTKPCRAELAWGNSGEPTKVSALSCASSVGAFLKTWNSTAARLRVLGARRVLVVIGVDEG